MDNPGYDFYVSLFRGVPRSVVKAVAPRHIEPQDPAECLCGWLARELVARQWRNRLRRRNADRVGYQPGSTGMCAKAFGGTAENWDKVFRGIVWHEETVRSAWLARVQECAA